MSYKDFILDYIEKLFSKNNMLCDVLIEYLF